MLAVMAVLMAMLVVMIGIVVAWVSNFKGSHNWKWFARKAFKYFKRMVNPVDWAEAYTSQRGNDILGNLVDTVMLFVIVGSVIAALWDTFVGTDTAIQELTGVDQATVLLQAIYPIGLLIAGVYFVVKLIKRAQQ